MPRLKLMSLASRNARPMQAGYTIGFMTNQPIGADMMSGKTFARGVKSNRVGMRTVWSGSKSFSMLNARNAKTTANPIQKTRFRRMLGKPRSSCFRSDRARSASG